MTFLSPPVLVTDAEATRRILDLDLKALSWRPVGVTWHNTGNPNLTRWRSYSPTTKAAWGKNYEFYCEVTNHWHSGPHAMGTPDGMAYLLCSFLADGVHSRCYNHTHYGIETVGNFATGVDDPKTGDGLASMKSSANLIASLCVRFGWDPDRAVNFHRECALDHHACPGDLVTREFALGLVKARIREIQAPAPARSPDLYTYLADKYKIDRSVVKERLFAFMYSNLKFTDEQMEAALVSTLPHPGA